MANYPQQPFGQGLSNGGDCPPNEKQNDDPQHGHYAESLRRTDMLIIFQDAGVRKHHTVCITCGQQEDSSHRGQWRKCRGECPLDPTYDHPGQPCSSLMRVANEDWCFSHVGETLLAECNAALGPEHQQRSEQQRKQRVNAPNPIFNRPPQQHGRPALPMGPPQGYWEGWMPPSRHSVNRRPTQRGLFGDYRELGHHAGHPDSSYGAEYKTYGSRDGSADSRHVNDGRYPAQSGPTRRPDFRERSPPRLPFLSYGYRDRAPSTDHTARQTPSSVSATERIADLRAQRVAERDSPSAPMGQSPTPPTQAQGAQGQVHQNLERRLREQEQRHQAAVTQLQQEATAADTRYEQLRRTHVALMEQMKGVLRNAAVPAFTPAPHGHIAAAAEPLRSNAHQPLPNQSAGYQSNDMLSSQEAESLQSAPGIEQQMAPSSSGNGLTPTGGKPSPFQPSSPGKRPTGG